MEGGGGSDGQGDSAVKRGLLLFVLLVCLLPVCLAGAAEDGTTSPKANPLAAPPREYLIGLPPPRQLPAADPAPRHAPLDQLLREAAEQQAAPLLAELRRQQDQGRVLGFSLDPARFAIRVTARGELPGLLAPVGYVADAADGPPTCAAGLPAAVAQMARAAGERETSRTTLAPRAAAAEPTIYAQVNAPYVGEYSAVWGFAAGDTQVEVRIYRNGSLYKELYGWSYDDGYFSISPYWDDCPRSGYQWYLQPGDVVEVSVGGEMSRTTVVPVVASFDPMGGIIEGQTAPNRRISGWIGLYSDPRNPCSVEFVDWSLDSQANGAFSIDVSAVPGMDRRSYAGLYVYDNDGNATVTYPETFSLVIETDYNSVGGAVHRGAAGTARLLRTGATIAQQPFVADATGYFWAYFDGVDVLPGDTISVNDGRMTLTTTMAAANFSLDAANNRIVGTSTAGRSVRAVAYARDDAYGTVRTACDWAYACRLAVAGAGGAVNIPLGFDVQPGDYAYIYVHDAEGNTQYTPSQSAPTLVTGPQMDWIRGFWSRESVDITVRLYDSAHNLKEEINEWASYQGEFYAYFWPPVAAGDRVEVTDGVTTLAMTVPALSGRLNSLEDELQLSGPARPFVATFENNDGYFSDTLECYQGSSSAGAVIDLAGRVSPGDYATVFVSLADGHYAAVELATFRAFVDQGSDWITVRAESPTGQFRLSQRRGGTTLYEETVTAQPPGYAYFQTGHTLTAGDVVQIEGLGNQAGLGTTITLTPMSAVGDSGRNAVAGVVAPNSLLIAWLARQTPGGGHWWGYYTDSDGAGRYDVVFNPDDYWGGGWRRACRNVLVSDRCAVPRVEYLTAGHHIVNLIKPNAPPAAADAFEPDNSAASAQLHPGGTRTHTFHATSDVDWVRVTVPAWAVGRPVTIRAGNSGWGVFVVMDLFRANGTTPVPNVAYRDDGQEQWLEWTPDAAGTYLLSLSPESDDSAAHCDAYYDLRVELARIGLPLVVGR